MLEIYIKITLKSTQGSRFIFPLSLLSPTKFLLLVFYRVFSWIWRGNQWMTNIYERALSATDTFIEKLECSFYHCFFLGFCGKTNGRLVFINVINLFLYYSTLNIVKGPLRKEFVKKIYNFSFFYLFFISNLFTIIIYK